MQSVPYLGKFKVNIGIYSRIVYRSQVASFYAILFRALSIPCHIFLKAIYRPHILVSYSRVAPPAGVRVCRFYSLYYSITMRSILCNTSLGHTSILIYHFRCWVPRWILLHYSAMPATLLATCCLNLRVYFVRNCLHSG